MSPAVEDVDAPVGRAWDTTTAVPSVPGRSPGRCRRAASAARASTSATSLARPASAPPSGPGRLARRCRGAIASPHGAARHREPDGDEDGSDGSRGARAGAYEAGGHRLQPVARCRRGVPCRRRTAVELRASHRRSASRGGALEVATGRRGLVGVAIGLGGRRRRGVPLVIAFSIVAIPLFIVASTEPGSGLDRDLVRNGAVPGRPARRRGGGVAVGVLVGLWYARGGRLPRDRTPLEL